MKKIILSSMLAFALTSPAFADSGLLSTKTVVSFETGSDELSEKAMEILDATVIPLNPSHVEIVGHSDDQGNSKKNFELSKSRADTVREYLVIKGLNQSVIHSSSGAGRTEPTCVSKTTQCKSQNRRVEVHMKYYK